MNSLFLTIFRIKAAAQVNTVLYFLQRLPLIGRLIPDEVYGMGEGKTALSALALVAGGGWSLLKKIMTFALLIVAPPLFINMVIYDDLGSLALMTQRAAYLFFIMGCLGLPYFNSVVLAKSSEKYIAIKFMRIPARGYLLATVPMQHAGDALLYVPIMLIMGLLGQQFLLWMGLWLCMFCFRFVAEAVSLFLFDKTGKILQDSVAGMVALILPLVLVAYIGMMVFPLEVLPVVYYGGMLASVVLGALSLWYLLAYKGYDKKIPRTLTMEDAAKTKAKKQNVQFTDVQMKESDLDEAHTSEKALGNKTGYAYFNALFFARHRRQLLKPVFIRLVLIGIVLLGGLLLFVVYPQSRGNFFIRIPEMLPLMVFFMYLLNTGSKAARALFYNCDIAMLRYGFYRQPRVVLQNFFIRLRHIGLQNLLVGGAAAAALSLLYFISGGGLGLPIVLFVLAILLLAVFFTVHNLFLYYVFQPYTTDLNSKNPFFTLINGVVYAISYACMQFTHAGIWFVVGVLAGTALYSAVALLLVYFYSPKKFRVK